MRHWRKRRFGPSTRARAQRGLALCHDPCRVSKRNGLRTLRNVHSVSIDVTLEPEVKQCAKKVGEYCSALHLLIYAVGLLHREAVQPERRLEHIDPAAAATSFSVNTIGPMLVAKHFFPLLQHEQRCVLANVSARVGSIEDNRLGGWYSYRVAKAAQNMFTKTLALESARRAKNLICVAMHPGTVDTPLSKPFQRGVPAHKLFSAKHAATQLLDVIDSLNEKDSGSFVAWDRQQIPW